MDYAIIKLGNKQHRVRDGETLVVDRLATEEGKSFEPVVLLGDDEGDRDRGRARARAEDPHRQVPRRTGYKRHNGFRAATSRVEITLGAGAKRARAAKAEKPAKPSRPRHPRPRPSRSRRPPRRGRPSRRRRRGSRPGTSR